MVRVRSLSALATLLAGALGVCPAQVFQTDSTNAAATVIQLVGNVWVQRDSQASSQWALMMGSQVKPQQIIVTGPDGYAEFRVSDGSTFEVFPNSRVTFRKSPGNWQDLLEMLLGRVKVHIQKLNGQPNPNRIQTPTAIISVRGTVFDVVVDDPDETFVAVDEGQVQVQHKQLGGEWRVLNPGDSIRILKNVPLAQRTIDKGSIVHGMLRAAADAIYTTIMRSPSGGSGGGVPSGGGHGGGGGGGIPGDHGDGKKPPAPGGGTSEPPGQAGPGAPPPPGS